MEIDCGLVEIIYNKFQCNVINFIGNLQAFSISVSIFEEDDPILNEPELMLFGEINGRQNGNLCKIIVCQRLLEFYLSSPVTEDITVIKVIINVNISPYMIKFMEKELCLGTYMHGGDSYAENILREARNNGA